MNATDLVKGALSHRISRRDLAKALAAAGLGVAMVPLIPGRPRAAGEITVFTWSGYEVPELHQAYAAARGGPPEFAFFGEEEEALQKMRAGYTPDISHPCYNSIGRWRDFGILKPIDVSRLKNWPDVWDTLKNLSGIHAQGEVWMCPFDWGNSSILYRTDLVDIEEQSWSILLDERYKGRMSVFDSVDAVAVITGLLTGAKNPFNMTDEEMKEARKTLQEIHKNLRMWWTDQTSLEQGLATGELVAAYAWNASVQALRSQGLPVEYMRPKEGILTWVCGLVLVKGAPGDEQAAYDFLDAFLDPSAGEFMINDYGYGHSNRKSYENVSAEQLAELGIAGNPEDHLNSGVFFDEIEPKAREKLIAMFEEVKAGG
jgi:spermidine/putrescine transport system substrate-binding protein